jgi:pimeloyl-ACP methyl ester carboxylesterase
MLKLDKSFVKLPNGETLAYVELGHGHHRVLLIHGNMSSSLHYLPLIERLPLDQFHIIAVDLRGFGDSSYVSSFNSLTELTEDVAHFLTIKDFHPCTIAGWSAGGGVALQLAANFPHFVEKLFLIDSMSYKGIPIFVKDATFKPIVGKVYPTKEEMATDNVQVAPVVKALKDGNVGFMEYIWNLVIYTGKKPDPEANKLYLAETMKQRNLVDFDWALVNFNMGTGSNFQADGDNSISKIKCPVLSVWGKKDITVLEYMVRETIAALGDKAQLIIYEEAGHSPLVDVPDQLAKDFIKFVL